MSTLLGAITNTKLKVRWQEPYVSEGLNRAMTALGKGITHGFIPSAPGGQNIRLEPDSALGESILVFHEASTGLVTVYQEVANVSYDVSAAAGTKIYIGATVVYTTGVATTGEIRYYSQAEYDADPADVEWLIGVDVPSGVTPIALTDYDWSVRSSAWTHETIDRRPWMQMIQDPMLHRDSYWINADYAGNGTSTVQSVTTNNAPRALRFLLSGATTGNDDAYRMAQSTAFVRPSTVVIVQFDAQSSGGFSADDVGVIAKFYDLDGVFISSSLFTPAALTGNVAWATYRGTIHVPATARSMEVGVGVSNLAAGTVYIEGVYVWTQTGRDDDTGDWLDGEVVRTPLLTLDSRQSATPKLATKWTDGSTTQWETIPASNASYTWKLGAASKTVAVDLEGSIDLTENITVAGDYEYSAGVGCYPYDVSPYQGGWTLTVDPDARYPVFTAGPPPYVTCVEPSAVMMSMRKDLAHLQTLTSAPPAGYVWQIDQLRVRAYLTDSASSAALAVRLMRRIRFDDASAAAAVTTLTAVDGGWQTLTYAGNHAIDPLYTYWLEADLTNKTAGSANEARIADVEITYKLGAIH